MSDSVRPHRRQPTRLPRPWDSPGKNTGVGCHFLLQCVKVKSESDVAQSGPTLSDPMDCSLPGSSNHGIFQARVLEWVAIDFSEEKHYDISIFISKYIYLKVVVMLIRAAMKNFLRKLKRDTHLIFSLWPGLLGGKRKLEEEMLAGVRIYNCY